MAATALDWRARRPTVRRFRFGVDDEDLVSRVRDGDEAAFEAIYDRYAPGVLAFCHHMLSSRDDAEDALQHSLSAAYRMLRAGDQEIELRPWLYTIARNRCLSVLRARRMDVSLEAAPEPGGIADELADQVQRRADLRDLVADLRLLPDDQRGALVLFELGGLPQDEIASVLDVRRDKVKALVFQAREGLMRARRARDTPCTEMRRQLATLAGSIPTRSMLRRHVDRCPSCALYQAEVGRQRAGLALILPVLPTVGLKALVLGSVGRGTTAVAGGGATAGGGLAVLGSAGGGGGVACAGATAGGGAAGLAGAGATAAAGGSVAATAAAAGGSVSGALVTAGGAGSVAAALGAKSATVVVAKLLTVAAVVVGGGTAATAELVQPASGPVTAPVEQQAASPAAPTSSAVAQLTAPSAPVPTVAPPVVATGEALPTAEHDPLQAASAELPLKPATTSPPASGHTGITTAASDGMPPVTGASDPAAIPTPAPAATSPATSTTETQGAAPPATTTPATTVAVTTTPSPAVGPAPAAGQNTTSAHPTGTTGTTGTTTGTTGTTTGTTGTTGTAEGPAPSTTIDAGPTLPAGSDPVVLPPPDTTPATGDGAATTAGEASSTTP